MAETNIAGLGGTIALPSGYNIRVSTWSASHTVETTDTTHFGSGGFREYEPTITTMSGSFGGHATYDASNTAPIPAALADGSVMSLGDLDSTKGTVTLTATTGCTFTGTAIITGTNFNRDVAGKLEVTGDFLFTGAFSNPWDQTG